MNRLKNTALAIGAKMMMTLGMACSGDKAQAQTAPTLRLGAGPELRLTQDGVTKQQSTVNLAGFASAENNFGASSLGWMVELGAHKSIGKSPNLNEFERVTRHNGGQVDYAGHVLGGLGVIAKMRDNNNTPVGFMVVGGYSATKFRQGQFNTNSQTMGPVFGLQLSAGNKLRGDLRVLFDGWKNESDQIVLPRGALPGLIGQSGPGISLRLAYNLFRGGEATYSCSL